MPRSLRFFTGSEKSAPSRKAAATATAASSAVLNEPSPRNAPVPGSFSRAWNMLLEVTVTCLKPEAVPGFRSASTAASMPVLRVSRRLLRVVGWSGYRRQTFATSTQEFDTRENP